MPTYRVLVVDDEQALRGLTSRELSAQGFICNSAADGVRAKELAKDQQFDVVVTDLRMPNMNGHTLAVDLLQLANPPIVIVVTGVSEPKIAQDLLARGVSAILTKPIALGQLAKIIEALIAQRHSQNAAIPENAENDAEARVETLQTIDVASPLGVELLRLANSSLHKPSGKRIARIEEAVQRLGQRVVTETAYALDPSIVIAWDENCRTR